MATYKVGSPAYLALMKKWSDEAWKEETATAKEEHDEHVANYGTSKTPKP